MITDLQIQNFKSFQNSGNLKIKPITFLVGPNSSGKTSIFQSILALRQTIRNKDQKSALILQDYIDLGSFKDVVWNHNLKNTITLTISDTRNHFEIEFGFNKDNDTIFVKKFRNFGIYNDNFKEFNFDYEVIKKSGKYFLNILNYTDFIGEKYRIKFQKFYQIDQEILSNDFFEKNKKQIKKDFENAPDITDIKDIKDLKDLKNITIFYSIGILNIFLSNQQLQLEKLINNIFHIGPLRREPQRVYTASGAYPSEVGKYGEWVVDELISNIEAQEKVKKWLKDFCIASDFKVEELKKGSKRYEILIKEFNTGIWINIADVGFGSSQILPIIVEGFITKNSTILIEQPEIHLHPKGQAIMGDLLVDIVTNQKNAILVETHSDLIISRVCTRIAKGDLDNSDVAIYYFNPTKNGTEIIDIGINKKGQFQNFPDGFFEERYEEALMKADYIC
ncbi:MAG: DUF3696 domain-containing protein [Candidatus Methanoperedens sp.]